MKTEEVAKQKAKLESVPALANLWKWQVKKIYGVEASLTNRQFGQLKNLRDKLGDLAGDVVDRTLKNWDAFCFYAKAQCALSCAPTVPNIGFLLVHAAEAVNAMHSLAKRTEPKSGADLAFIDMVDRAIAAQKNEAEEHGDATSEVHLGETTPEQAPQPIQETPTRLKFTPEQIAVLIAGSDDELYEKFMAAIGEKYGEDCIMGHAGHPETAVLCDIPV